MKKTRHKTRKNQKTKRTPVPGNVTRRAMLRWNGSQKMLRMLARGAPIDAGPRGMSMLERKYQI